MNIPRYVDTFEEEEVVPLAEVAKELREVQAEIDKLTEDLLGMLGSLTGTTDEAKEELRKFIELMSK